MKRLLVLTLISVITLELYAQAPEGFSYQALVRNNAGNPIVSRDVSFRFGIIQGSPAGPAVYSEIHYTTTDEFGMVSLVIGNGTDKSGNFTTIDWGSNSYFLKVELDTTGSTLFTYMGTSQLLSVPYALFAKKAGNGFSGDYNDLINKPVVSGDETKVISGNNIIITGSGTAMNPYVINERTHFVGESFGGGIVFYVYDNGRHGLIASRSDQDREVEWYNGVRRYTNTTGDGINAGMMNTALIVALQTNDNPLGSFAAKICADYSVTVDGITYGDWYLPSKYELNLMFQQKNIIGGFSEKNYWSSTEFSSLTAWSQNFSTGVQSNLNKSVPYSVRAIRAF